jgi:hypothetical protein
VDIARPTRVRQFIGAKEVIIWVCFSRSGIENIILLLPKEKETFDREFFVEQVLSDFDKERAQDCPRKCSRNTFLHLGNAIPHQALLDFDRLRIAKLPHQLYSHNLASCNFWLFGMLKRKLERFTFEIKLKCWLQ